MPHEPPLAAVDLLERVSRLVVEIDDAELARGVGRTPLDQHVIWTGHDRGGRADSILALALTPIQKPWTPFPLREIIYRAARLSASQGLLPDAVRRALWGHQAAQPASYFLVRRGQFDEYFAVTDIPRPSSWNKPIRAGDTIMTRTSRLDRALQRASEG